MPIDWPTVGLVLGILSSIIGILVFFTGKQSFGDFLPRRKLLQTNRIPSRSSAMSASSTVPEKHLQDTRIRKSRTSPQYAVWAAILVVVCGVLGVQVWSCAVSALDLPIVREVGGSNVLFGLSIGLIVWFPLSFAGYATTEFSPTITNPGARIAGLWIMGVWENLVILTWAVGIFFVIGVPIYLVNNSAGLWFEAKGTAVGIGCIGPLTMLLVDQLDHSVGTVMAYAIGILAGAAVKYLLKNPGGGALS